MGRITITLEPDEQEALWKLAGRECRDPRQEMRMILRRELQGKGLLGVSDEERQKEEAEVREEARLILDAIADEYGVHLELARVGDPLTMMPGEWVFACLDAAVAKRMGGVPEDDIFPRLKVLSGETGATPAEA